MKKVAIYAVAISLLLALSTAGLAWANPHPGPGPPSIEVSYLPHLSSNTVTLKVHVTVWQDTNSCTREAWYSLDGQKNVSIPLTFKGWINEGSYYEFSEVTGEIEMPMWSSGPHTLNVTVVYNYGNFVLADSKTLYIGQPEPTSTPPIFSIISPKDQATYNPDYVPITYSINANVTYAYYALDLPDDSTSGWKRFDGNITLTGLSEGSHKIEIFVRTEETFPAFAEKTVYFEVDSSVQPSQEALSSPTPTTPEFPALIITVSVAIACSASLLMLKRKI